MKRSALLAVLASVMLFALPAISSGGSFENAPWHLKGWQRRTAYTLTGMSLSVEKNVRAGKMYARIDVRTAKLEREDGSDIRVLDEKGVLLKTWTGKRKDNGIRTIYCRPGKAKRVLVYYGNPDAKNLPTGYYSGWPLSRHLYKLEGKAYRYTAGSLKTAVGLTARLKKSRTKPTIEFEAHSVNYSKAGSLPATTRRYPGVLMFSGYIFAPWTGKYYFGTDSMGPSFILINGKEIAAWPGPHWKHGSFIHGDTVMLTRGVHSFLYVNQSTIGQPSVLLAGWKTPGANDSETIPSYAFVRFGLLRPVFTQQAPGKPVADCEVIGRYNVTLNDSEPMSDIEFKAFGPGAQDAEWKLEFLGRQSEVKGDFPMKVRGDKADFFFAKGGNWRVTLSVPDCEPLKLKFSYSKTAKLLPFYLDCDLDSLPGAVFRGRPFGLLLNVPNETTFSPLVDFTVEQKTKGWTAREKTLRHRMYQGKHVVADIIFNPRKADIFTVPGIPFSPVSSTDPGELYRSAFFLKANVNGYRVADYSFAFLQKDDPLSEEIAFNKDGFLVSKGRRLVLLSEMDDARDYRRWAVFKRLKKLGEKHKSFLLLGDSYTKKGKGLLDYVAAELKKQNVEANVVAAALKPYPFYSSVVRALELLETGKHDCLVVATGFEDAFVRAPYKTIETLLHSLVDRARAKGIKHIVVLLPPRVPGYTTINGKYRNMLKDISARMMLETIDLASSLDNAFRSNGDCSTRYPLLESLFKAARVTALRLCE